MTAAIVLWNTMRDHGQTIDPTLIPHLSPLGWEHINLTGDYAWEAEESLNPDQFRPLRTRSGDLAMAA